MFMCSCKASIVSFKCFCPSADLITSEFVWHGSWKFVEMWNPPWSLGLFMSSHQSGVILSWKNEYHVKQFVSSDGCSLRTVLYTSIRTPAHVRFNTYLKSVVLNIGPGARICPPKPPIRLQGRLWLRGWIFLTLNWVFITFIWRFLLTKIPAWPFMLHQSI